MSDERGRTGGRLRQGHGRCGVRPVTVKHRIGIDKIESYDFVRDFVGTVADAGCQVFVVIRCNARLKGSPQGKP
jgi:tRNA-dihydrouridine synthase